MKPEDLKKLKEPLDIENVDFRIQSINKGGYATILAYKNARVDMERLDSACSPHHWQRDHKELKGNIYCGIGIKIDSEWTWKWDCGSESMSDKEKGEASDSFKRAGFNWGIGRELYEYPLIQVKLNNDEFKVDGARVKQSWELKLKEWDWLMTWDCEEIATLTAIDQKGAFRYIYAIDLDQLEMIWKNYPELQSEASFKNLVNKTKKELS